MKTYLIDEDQFQKMRAIQARLHGGSDAMRDEGHRLWLVLNEVAEQAEEMPETPAPAQAGGALPLSALKEWLDTNRSARVSEVTGDVVANYAALADQLEGVRDEMQAGEAIGTLARRNLLDSLRWALSHFRCKPFEWTDDEDAEAHRRAIALVDGRFGQLAKAERDARLRIIDNDIRMYEAGVDEEQRRLRSCLPSLESHYRNRLAATGIVLSGLRNLRQVYDSAPGVDTTTDSEGGEHD